MAVAYLVAIAQGDIVMLKQKDIEHFQQMKELTRICLLRIVQQAEDQLGRRFPNQDEIVATLAGIFLHESFSRRKFALNAEGRGLILDALKIECRLDDSSAELILDDLQEAICVSVAAKEDAKIPFLTSEVQATLLPNEPISFEYIRRASGAR